MAMAQNSVLNLLTRHDSESSPCILPLPANWIRLASPALHQPKVNGNPNPNQEAAGLFPIGCILTNRRLRDYYVLKFARGES